MNGLIVYDSYFGNTKKVAEILNNSFTDNNISVLNVDEVTEDDIKDLDFIIVGSPTRAFTATTKIKEFVKKYSSNIKGVKFVSFDTRMSLDDVDSKFLKFMAKRFGYAAEVINKLLLKAGAVELINPNYFYVKDTEGPLKDDEIEKVKTWVKDIESKLK